MHKPTNDNNAFHGSSGGPDAHGQAALLLVESLIHNLVSRSVIGVDDAVDIVSVAVDAAEEMAADAAGSPAARLSSVTMLLAISQSLTHDL